MGKNEKTVIPRYFLSDGNILEFSCKEELEKWMSDYVEKNPGKGLSLEGTGTRRTTVILGNEVSLKSEVVTETRSVETQVLKVELGEIKSL